jgi:hypothetical protein
VALFKPAATFFDRGRFFEILDSGAFADANALESYFLRAILGVPIVRQRRLP